MPRQAALEGAWLTLDEAAKRLHVHPTTLREWADKGRIRTFRTPGGHRRFSESDVNAVGARTTPDLALFMHATVGQARLATSGGRLAAEPWYARFDDKAKERQRELGMELMGVLVEFLAEPEKSPTKSIQALGRRYAELARDVGLSVGDAMRAFHLFEGLVRASVDQLSAARVGVGGLEQHVGWFLNEVEVAMVELLAREE